MATKLSGVIVGTFPELRFEPTAKRIRASLGGNTVVDTLHAWLVWEPKRITPIYAVPEAELLAELAPPRDPTADVPEFGVRLSADSLPSLDPRTGFGRHTTPGEQLDVVTGTTTAPGAAFRRTTPTWPGMSCWISPPFSGGKTTRKSSATPATPSTAWTSGPHP
ncbi:hypothetical protein AHiyo8_25330 [Arthrobacter sp. Hiyo8]|nr:hypothetical protein AHiyo8_25330 [Arthrobacter sp. Hiyo8]